MGEQEDPKAFDGQHEEAQSGGEEDADIEAARVQIEQTRADMGETIDAIQEKLSPEYLAEQAKESAKQAALARATGVWDSVRHEGEEVAGSAIKIAEDARSAAMQAARGKTVPVAVGGIALLTTLVALLLWRLLGNRPAPEVVPPTVEARNEPSTGRLLFVLRRNTGR